MSTPPPPVSVSFVFLVAFFSHLILGINVEGQSLREIDRTLAGQNAEDWSVTGFYVGGFLGLTSTEDTTLNSVNGSPPPDDYDFEFKDGLSQYIFFGWDTGNIRGETEIGGRIVEIDSVAINGSSVAGQGEIAALSIMWNLIFDIPVTEKIEAYVGGGIGAGFLWSDIDVSGLTDSSDVVFAYQLMAGLSVEVAPRLYLLTGYRIHSFDDPNFDGNEYDAPLIHSIDFGLRYVF